MIGFVAGVIARFVSPGPNEPSFIGPTLLVRPSAGIGSIKAPAT